MKFNFRILAILLSVLVGACRGAHETSAPPPGIDGGDAQRVVALLDYVSTDYLRAVQDGRVSDPAEYAEQQQFVRDAQRFASELTTSDPKPESKEILTSLDALRQAVDAKADATEVARLAHAARESVVSGFGLRTMPMERPSLAKAQALYRESCLPCHGPTGAADTDAAKVLEPRPAKFNGPEYLAALSPYRVYNTLTFGVTGTSMATFNTLSSDDRWSLAFYVFHLGHEGETERGPVAMGLADMASLTDREIGEQLRAARHPAPAQGIAYVRRTAAFEEPPAGVGIEHTRRLVRRAAQAFRRGSIKQAEQLILDAYLQGFEPLEPRLRARDLKATHHVETLFHGVRTALTHGDGAELERAVADLDEALLALGGGRGEIPFLTAFIIFSREGIEAALLVGALLAGVRRMGRADARAYVHAGWIAAIPAGVATWWVTSRLVSLGSARTELMEAVIALTAAFVLFTMSFWMISKAESRRWTGYLRKSLERTLHQRNLFLLAGVAFLAVYREAAETVLFTQALLLEAGTKTVEVWAGAATGLLLVVLASALMSRAVVRLPIGPFFAVSSILLCILAASFAGSGLYALVSAGYLRPRPVDFPEISWLGIYPDATSLGVQLAIVLLVAGAGFVSLRHAFHPKESEP